MYIYIYLLKGCLYQRQRRTWTAQVWDKVRSLRISGQTNQTRGRRRHMAQTDWPLCFKAHIHTHTQTYKPTSSPHRQPPVHLSLWPAMRPGDNKISFPPRWAGEGCVCVGGWTLALRSVIQGKHERRLISSLIKEATRRREAHRRRL